MHHTGRRPSHLSLGIELRWAYITIRRLRRYDQFLQQPGTTSMKLLVTITRTETRGRSALSSVLTYSRRHECNHLDHQIVPNCRVPVVGPFLVDEGTTP